MAWKIEPVTPRATPKIEGKLGPAMRALPNDRWRAFVLAMHEIDPRTGQGSGYTEACIKAGFQVTNTNSAQVQGHRLAHDERIIAAFVEEGQRRLGTMLPLSLTRLHEILADPTAERKDILKAIGMVFNRTGLPEQSEHKVVVAREYSDDEKIERIVRLAKALGLDPKAVLGQAGVPMVTDNAIEAEFVDVTDDFSALPEDEQ